MNCPKCGTNLIRVSRDGDTLVSARGFVLKSDSIAAICPHCKADVPFSQTLTKALQDLTILFFKKS